MPPTKPQKPLPAKGTEPRKRTGLLLLAIGLGGVAAYLFLRPPPAPPVEVDTKRAADIKGVFAGGPTKTSVNSKPAETRGAFAADEVMQLAGKAGSAVIVKEVPGPMMANNSDMARFLNMISSEAEAFKDRLQEKGKFTFLPDLELPRADGTARTQWPAGAFSQLLQRTPGNAAIVMFCMPPAQLTEGEKAQLRSRPGKVVVVAGSETELKPMVEQRLIHLAVTSRVPIPPPPKNAAETPMQWVVRVHTVLKP